MSIATLESSMRSSGPGRAVSVAPPAVSAEDRLFIALLNGFRGSSGLQRLGTLKAVRRSAWPGAAIERLPSAIAERRVLGLAWNRELWLPDFQFDTGGTIKPMVAAVYAELTASYDPWELAAWFVTPSTWLQGNRPIDSIEDASARLVDAARADRYVASGS